MKKKLKGLIAIYLACILLMATPLSAIAANTAMLYVAAKGIVIGKTSTTLNPKDSLTRAEFAEMIYRFLEK